MRRVMRVNRQVIISLLAILLLSACGFIPAPTPEVNSVLPTVTPTVDIADPYGVAAAFLNAWMAGDYEAMYSHLTSRSQAEYTQNDFTQRYQTTASTMQLTALDAAPLSELRSLETSSQIAFRVTFTSAVLGDIEVDNNMFLQFADGRWGVVWDPGLILQSLSGDNNLQLTVENPARANIYDRNGDWLVAADQTLTTIIYETGSISDNFEGDMLNLLSQLLRTPPDQIQQNYAGLPDGQFVALGAVDTETLQQYWNRLNSYPGITWRDNPGRIYYNLLAPHVLGYTSFIPEEQLASYQARGYKQDDIVGIIGLEAAFEEYLAGTRGGELTVWTPSGSYIGQIARRDPQPAQSVHTTLDRELQIIVQDAIEDAYRYAQPTWAPTAGGTSVIVMEVNTGAILAMASYPYFDPNVFHPNNNHPLATTEYFNSLNTNPRKPYLNRSTQGLYPPGSIFKIVSAAAALGSGVYQPGTSWNCTGIWTGLGSDEGNIRYDWKEDGHGIVNLSQALTGSCNPYFYEIGLETGNKDFFIIANYAHQFGLGTELGIEIDEETGQIPDPDWLWQNQGEQWDVADSVNIAIGQGAIQITPLQMVTMASAIANGGTVYRPRLVDHIGLIGEEPTIVYEPEVVHQVNLTAEQWDAIRQGMLGVTTDPVLGTAEYRLGSMQIEVAGKTGTAQVSQPGVPPIAWFLGYAPFDEPEIAIVVMVENGGQGSSVAAPIFRRIVENWYGLTELRFPPDWADPDSFDFVTDDNFGE